MVMDVNERFDVSSRTWADDEIGEPDQLGGDGKDDDGDQEDERRHPPPARRAGRQDPRRWGLVGTRGCEVVSGHGAAGRPPMLRENAVDQPLHALPGEARNVARYSGR